LSHPHVSAKECRGLDFGVQQGRWMIVQTARNDFFTDEDEDEEIKSTTVFNRVVESLSIHEERDLVDSVSESNVRQNVM
jgi:hypothetical protein